MRKGAGWWCIIAFFAMPTTANAQTPSPPTPVTAFDGTYSFVSATNVNEIYTTTATEHIKRCNNNKAGLLTITNGAARLPRYEGTVGAHGELRMRHVPEPAPRVAWGSPGIEGIVSGRVDKDGTVRARRMNGSCSYDIIWRKETK